METQIVLPFLPMPVTIHDGRTWEDTAAKIVRVTNTTYVVVMPMLGKVWFCRATGRLQRIEAQAITPITRQLRLINIRALANWRRAHIASKLK